MDNTAQISPAQQQRDLLAQKLKEKAARLSYSYPLSVGQKALWFLHKMTPGNAAYNVGFAAILSGDVDVKRLTRAFQHLINRHPSLRANFILQDNEPLQHISGYRELAIERIDASHCSATELREWVDQAYKRPFDLEHDLLFRAHLFTQRQDRHIFLLTAHHIIGDGWSMWLVLEEWRKLYLAESINAQALPVPASEYRAFIEWQKDFIVSDAGMAAKHYWAKKLAGKLPILDCPGGSTAQELTGQQARSVNFTFNAALTKKLKALAAANGVTFFTCLLSIYFVLLSRYTRQKDIVVGTVCNGRTTQRFTSVVGYFVNMLPLRADLSANPCFKDFLAQVNKTFLESLEFQDYPFSNLVTDLAPQRSRHISPIFQSSFLFQQSQHSADFAGLMSGAVNAIEFADVKLESFSLNQQEQQFPIAIELTEVNNVLHACIKYDAAYFPAHIIERMVESFALLAEDITESPEKNVMLLNIISPQEYLKVTEEFNKGAEINPDNPLHSWPDQYDYTSIAELFERQAHLSPTAIALIAADQELTYATLNRKANQLAHALMAAGARTGSLVAVSLERGVELVIALLAVVKSGAAYVPLDPNYPVARQKAILQDCKAHILLTENIHIEKTLAEAIADATLININPLDTLLAAYATENPVHSATPDDVSYVIYTSGSTGQPKGVMVPNLGISNRIQWMQIEHPLDNTNAVLYKTPYSFDVSVCELFWPLVSGARLIIAKPGGHKEPSYLNDLIKHNKVTHIHFVPSMLQMFLETEGVKNCVSLQRIFCSGEALPKTLQDSLFKTLPDVGLYNLYGPTEASVDVSQWVCNAQSPFDFVPIGKPILGTQLYILDENLTPLPRGIIGELYIGGVQLAKGYLNRPELNAHTFICNPLPSAKSAYLYRTGDLVRFLEDGNIQYLGREDQQIKLRGYRIELGEIEEQIMQFNAVIQAVVVMHDHPQTGKRLVAYLVARHALDLAELKLFLRASLPEFMVPTSIVELDSLPLTASGKTNRKALMERPVDAVAIEYVAPQSPTEITLAAIFSELLNKEKVGIYDDFFELGGHSLIAMQVVTRVKQTFAVDLAVASVFDQPVIAELAEYIDTLLWATAPITEATARDSNDIEEVIL